MKLIWTFAHILTGQRFRSLSFTVANIIQGGQTSRSDKLFNAKCTISPVSWGWNRSDIWVYSAWRGSDLDWFFPSASSSRKKPPALTSRKEDGPTCHSLSASAPRRADNKDDIPEYKTGRYRVKEIEDINCVGRDSTWVQLCHSDMWAMCFR